MYANLYTQVGHLEIERSVLQKQLDHVTEQKNTLQTQVNALKLKVEQLESHAFEDRIEMEETEVLINCYSVLVSCSVIKVIPALAHGEIFEILSYIN